MNPENTNASNLNSELFGKSFVLLASLAGGSFQCAFRNTPSPSNGASMCSFYSWFFAEHPDAKESLPEFGGAHDADYSPWQGASQMSPRPSARPASTMFSLNSAEVRASVEQFESSPNADQIWTNLDQLWATFGRNRPVWVRCWPGLCPLRPTLAEFDQIRAIISQMRAPGHLRTFTTFTLFTTFRTLPPPPKNTHTKKNAAFPLTRGESRCDPSRTEALYNCHNFYNSYTFYNFHHPPPTPPRHPPP